MISINLWYVIGVLVCLLAGLYKKVCIQNRQYALLKRMSKIDPLTGLLNRQDLEKEWTKMIKLLIRLEKSTGCRVDISCLFIDLDYFKKVNDEYGHSAGDQVLQLVAFCIKSVLRSTDFACRYGGEEIVVFLPQADSVQAMAVAEKIRLAVNELSFPGDASLKVSVSIGVACTTPQSEIKSIIDEADKALYKAKHNGRNQVIFVE